MLAFVRFPLRPFRLGIRRVGTAFLLLALLLPAAAGCGLFSDDDEPLAGVYESREFRVKRASGENDDVGDDGARLVMTLREDGGLEGELTVVSPEATEPPSAVPFTGSYTRDADRLAFDFDEAALSPDYFDTGTPLADIGWIFYEEEGLIGADDEAYVLFLEREADVAEAAETEPE